MAPSFYRKKRRKLELFYLEQSKVHLTEWPLHSSIRVEALATLKERSETTRRAKLSDVKLCRVDGEGTKAQKRKQGYNNRIKLLIPRRPATVRGKYRKMSHALHSECSSFPFQCRVACHGVIWSRAVGAEPRAGWVAASRFHALPIPSPRGYP